MLLLSNPASMSMLRAARRDSRQADDAARPDVLHRVEHERVDTRALDHHVGGIAGRLDGARVVVRAELGDEIGFRPRGHLVDDGHVHAALHADQGGEQSYRTGAR